MGRKGVVKQLFEQPALHVRAFFFDLARLANICADRFNSGRFGGCSYEEMALETGSIKLEIQINRMIYGSLRHET